jgi:hypothetical protein
MEDISGFGTEIMILALQSFPMGFSLSKFADDTDPISAKEMEPFGYEPLYDGTIFTYAQAAPIEVSVSVIPNSDEDINLKILLGNKKGGLSLFPFEDITTMAISYPDGGRTILSHGSILRGPALDSIQSTGRRKSNTYTFVFGTVTGAQSAKQLIAGGIQSALGFFG